MHMHRSDAYASSVPTGVKINQSKSELTDWNKLIEQFEGLFKKRKTHPFLLTLTFTCCMDNLPTTTIKK